MIRIARAVGLAVTMTLGLLVTAPLTAKEGAKPAVATSTGHPALWEVQGKRGKLYLFGTFHALPVGLKWRTALLEKAIKRSDRLVTEVVLSEMKDPKSVQAIGAMMAVQGFTTANESGAAALLTPPQLLKLEKAVEKQGMPKAIALRLRPWFATLLLAQSMIAEAGYAPELGAEQQLIKSFGKKPNLGLEGVTEQLSVFTTMDPETAKQALKETLDESSTGAARLKTLSDAWASGDAAIITAEMVTESAQKYPKFHLAVFNERNAKWVPKLEKYLDQKGTTFVAVGAGHYYGPGGLLDLMAQRGIKVKQVQ
jgi:uncharacterized protein